MRSNIRDIMAATNCSENQANQIEQEINRQWLIDWSEATAAQVQKAAQKVHHQLIEADHYRWPKTYNGK